MPGPARSASVLPDLRKRRRQLATFKITYKNECPPGLSGFISYGCRTQLTLDTRHH
jgi:hypothetical protein